MPFAALPERRSSRQRMAFPRSLASPNFFGTTLNDSHLERPLVRRIVAEFCDSREVTAPGVRAVKRANTRSTARSAERF